MLQLLARSGGVQRFHTVPTIKPDTVAAHSWGVALWCTRLAGGKPSADLLLAALVHDTPEVRTGDLPSPFRASLCELEQGLDLLEAVEKVYYAQTIPMPELCPLDALRLEFADAYDAAVFCARERALGNVGVAFVFWATRKKLAGYVDRLANAGPMLEELDAFWAEVCAPSAGELL